MRSKDVLGRYGEDVAAAHLSAHGLEVLDRNWRCRQGELDIVAREGPVLVFVEVKARSSTRFGTPAEAVHPAKARRIRLLACQWLAEHRPAGAGEVRFDVVSVLCPPGGPPELLHLRASF